jgi:hypothetical protein
VEGDGAVGGVEGQADVVSRGAGGEHGERGEPGDAQSERARMSRTPKEKRLFVGRERVGEALAGHAIPANGGGVGVAAAGTRQQHGERIGRRRNKQTRVVQRFRKKRKKIAAHVEHRIATRLELNRVEQLRSSRIRNGLIEPVHIIVTLKCYFVNTGTTQDASVALGKWMRCCETLDWRTGSTKTEGPRK